MRCVLLFMLWFAVPSATLHAQQDATSAPPPDTPYVLHVYENLVQMVTLVMTPDGKIVPPVPKSKFAITIDAGPKFPPTQMHVEGDDPISLAIVIDARGSQQNLSKRIPEALDSLTPHFLHPQDHISVYAFDCVFLRSAYDLPAVSGEASSAVKRLFDAPSLHSQSHHACGKVSLWDAVVKATANLGELPGRRVMLIISDGRFEKGAYSPTQAIEFAQAKAIAVFGMRDLGTYTDQHMNHGAPRDLRFALPLGDGSDEDLFDTLCQKNGGALTTVSTRSVPKAMQYFVTLLRSRYILEFPRPDEDVPGRHIVDITIPKTNLYIRPAGLTLPTAPKRDPNTLPPTPSPATFGKRRPISPSH
jgi:hypothetical protein